MTKDKGGAEEFTQYLLDFANHLAGKSTSDIEKGLKKLFSKKANKVLQTLNNTKKANSVIGNISTILKQPTNVINGLGVLENPIMIFKGIKDTVVGVTNENIKRRYKESNFLTERFLDKSYSVFEKNSPLKFFSDMLGWADEFGARSVWNAAYDDALKLKKTGKNLILTLQDMPTTRRAQRLQAEVSARYRSFTKVKLQSLHFLFRLKCRTDCILCITRLRVNIHPASICTKAKCQKE